MLAKITLTKASVIGSYEYVAIFILKKEEPQITASKINKDKSNCRNIKSRAGLCLAVAMGQKWAQ